MAADEGVDLSALDNQQSETYWKQEMEKRKLQVDALHEKLMEVKACIQGSEKVSKKELEILWKRVKTNEKVLAYLKTTARFVADPELAQLFCGIEQLDDIGLVDRHGIPLSDWTRTIDLSPYECPDSDLSIGISGQHCSLDEHDEAYNDRVLTAVQMVADVMETLVKRVLLAESETAYQKDKVICVEENIRTKEIQLENMSMQLGEMKQVALVTGTLLTELQDRVNELVIETTRQRLRAAENEQDLTRVKHDFELLKSYVSDLINKEETPFTTQQEMQENVRLFYRLFNRATELESEKMQKEAEVHKLMEENLSLSTLLDKKEAQLLAMNEQCKVMALNASNI